VCACCCYRGEIQGGGFLATGAFRELAEGQCHGARFGLAGSREIVAGRWSRAFGADTRWLSPAVEADFHRGNAYRDKGDNDRAIADYTHAIELKPTFAAAYYSRGLVYSKQGETDRAIAGRTRAIQLLNSFRSPTPRP
jgi:tetratricopeptide (TPR) repeat protein